MQFVDSYNDLPTEASKDIPNVRIIHTRYGFDVRLERRDPYGFVHVVWNKGPVPEVISGAYSDFDQARGAVSRYLENETFNKIVDEPVQIEKAQYKKRFREQQNG